MWIKDIEVPFLTPLDEPSSILVHPGYREKIAETKICSEIYKELENFEGVKNRTYILVVAVSPVEYWGPNKNNDAFTEYWLKKKHHTFVTRGTFYKNHANKDPSKNYGENVRSWYDDTMKRVLVLVAVDNNKAPDIVQDIEMGKIVKVSMGTKIQYDECIICKNKAPTRKEYCHHMLYEAGKIYPDGRRVYCLNPDPDFFDLSKVIRPAGYIEYMIKKVNPIIRDGGIINITSTTITTGNSMKQAEEIVLTKEALEEKAFKLALLEDKIARLDKLSTMHKALSGQPIDDSHKNPKLESMAKAVKSIPSISSTEDLDDDTIEKLSKEPMGDILRTSNSMGICLKVPEIVKITIIKKNNGDRDIDKLEKDTEGEGFKEEELLDSDNPFEFLKDNKNLFSKLMDSPIFNEGNITDSVFDTLIPFFEKRSCLAPCVEKRAFDKDYCVKSGAALDTQVVSDASGNQYLTTNEAVDRAKEMRALLNVGKGLGTGALMGLASLAAMKLPVIGGAHLIPAALFGGAMAGKKLNDRFGEKPLSGDTPPYTAVSKIGALNKEDLEKIAAIDETQQMLYGMAPNYSNNFWQFARENPALSTFAGLALGGLGLKGIGGFNKTLAGLFQKTDPIAQAIRGTKMPLSEKAILMKNFKNPL